MLKNTKPRREQKRVEAEARQIVYDKLSLADKLAKTKPGSRQYKRLTAKEVK